MIAARPPRIVRIQPTRWFARPASIDAAIDALESRARVLACARDGRAGFCEAYAGHLVLARGALLARPGAASAWTERIEVAQAQRYLGALAGWDRGDRSLTPAPWRAAFALARHSGAPARALVAAAIAHLAYGLPLTIARTAPGQRAAFDAMARVPWPGIAARDVARLMRGAWDDAAALGAAPGDQRRQYEFTRIESAALRALRALAAG